jgi:hypothetical protein
LGRISNFVIAGLVPANHPSTSPLAEEWVAGINPAMTIFE